MRRIKLTIEYDGADFHGWQFQPGLRTVQSELEGALSKVLKSEIRIMGAGRTDSGVHAKMMVAHFDTENDLLCKNILMGTNTCTGADVNVLDATEVDPAFHSRFDAKSRSYIYSLINRVNPLKRHYAWYPNCKYDLTVLHELAPELIGRHSFKAFSRSRQGETEYICEVTRAEWHEVEGGLEFHISANRFMHRMVRGLVGSLIDTARGYITKEDFLRMLHQPQANGEARTAPAKGLTLVHIEY